MSHKQILQTQEDNSFERTVTKDFCQKYVAPNDMFTITMNNEDIKIKWKELLMYKTYLIHDILLTVDKYSNLFDYYLYHKATDNWIKPLELQIEIHWLNQDIKELTQRIARLRKILWLLSIILMLIVIF